MAVEEQLRRQLKSRSLEVGTWVTRATLEEEKRKSGEMELAWKRKDLSRAEERLREEESKRVKCEEEMERLKESIRDTAGTGGVVQSGEVVGVDSRGGGDNEEGEHSGGTDGEASDSVKVSGADGGGQRMLKLADYICGRRQERGNMTRGSGGGKGEWGIRCQESRWSSSGMLGQGAGSRGCWRKNGGEKGRRVGTMGG